MAYCFGDSFDLYTAATDPYGNGYWDSGVNTFTLVTPGRFSGRWCLQIAGGGGFLVKSSGSNDAVHHLVCAFKQDVALSGTTLDVYFQLSDGATNQCCIVFRSDGAILLTSATPVGTVLATYTGAVTLINQWFAFEFEVIIHPTAGRFRVRKNGNASDDFDSGATLNTRPGTNSYANKLTVGGQASVFFQYIDDLLWRSDASSVPFVGDVRCYTRMPASDASVQFSRTSTGAITQTVPTSAPNQTGTSDYFTLFVASYSGTVTSVGVAVFAVGTATGMKCAIYADNGSNGPGAVLASATAIAAPPVAGTNTFTFSPGVTVTQGVKYWIGATANASTCTHLTSSATAATGATAANSYATFPQPNPVVTNPALVGQKSWTYNAAPANWQAVSEAQQDSATSYVYSSNVGDTDLYGIASIGVTPASTIAVTTRAFVQKSDAGSRSGKVLLKSGGTTVDTGSAPLSTTWAQMWRTDTVDPATGTAWTAVGVNAAQIGVAVTS